MTEVIARQVLELTTDDSGLKKGLADAESRVKGFGDKIGGLSQGFTSFGKSATELGTSLSTKVSLPIIGLIGSLGALAVSSANTGDEIAKSARAAGLSSKSYQELAFALTQTADVSNEELTKGFGKLSTLLADAENGSKPAIAALEKLGFSQSQIASGSISTEQAINAMTAAMQNAASPAQAIALAGDLVGDRLGPKLAGALRAGGGEIDSLRQQFRDLNLGMSDEALGASEKFMDQLDVLGRQFTALGKDLAEQLLPVLTEQLVPAFQTHLVPLLQKVVEGVSGAITWFGNLPGPVQAGVAAVVGLAAAVGPLLVGIGAVATAIGAALPVIATIGGALATLAAGPIGIAVAAVVGLGAAWTLWGDDVTRIVGEIYAAVKEWLVDKFEAVWSGLQTALETAGGWWTTLKDGAVGAASTILEGVKTSLGTLTRVALLPMTAPIEGVLLAFKHWDEITRIAEQIYLGVKKWMLDQFQIVVDRVKGAVSSVTGAFKSMYDAVVGNSFVPDLITRIEEEFGKLPDVMEVPAKASTDRTAGSFRDLLSNVGDMFSPSNLKALITDPMGTVKNSLVGMWDRAKADITGTLQSIGSIFKVDFLGGLSKALGDFAPTFISLLSNLGSMSGKRFVEELANKILGFDLTGLISRWTGGPSPERLPRVIGRRQNPETGEWEPVIGTGVEADDPRVGPGPNESHTTDDADNQGHARGTPRLDFKRFRWGQRVPLHDWEAVIPRGSGHLLANEIAAALPAAGGRQNIYNTYSFPNALVVDRAALERFAEEFTPVQMQFLADRRIVT